MWDGEALSQPFYKEWEMIDEMIENMSAELSPECDPQGDATGLPESLFRGGIYDKYCEEVEKNKDTGVTWLVDHEGNQVQDKVRRGGSAVPWLPRALRPRTPLVDPDNYEGYIIELKWEPTEDGGACPESCKDALHGVSLSPCKSTTTHSNPSRQSRGTVPRTYMPTRFHEPPYLHMAGAFVY